MLENKEQWEDVGYKVVEGDFVEGSSTVIERPAEHSLPTISKHQEANQIIQAVVCNSFQEEIDEVVRGIRSDIQDGLKPEDILVVIVDDRNVQVYIDALVEALAGEDIFCNNIHSDRYGIRDFHKDGFVTLSTVHKAKGNEAYMVYVMGVDALFTLNANVRDRNKLFTAITRAKGWVKVTGVGENAMRCKAEIDEALENFPYLVFNYPSQEQLKVLKRDLAEKAIRKQKAERQLDLVLGELTPEEVQRYLAQKEIKKGK
jgi:superfamily I DNA and RNA helicase